MKKLYKLDCTFGRMGEIESLFISDDKSVEEAIGKEVYFGEVLGKHSEIFFDLEPDDIQEVSDDQELVEKLLELYPKGTVCGLNPLNNLSEER